LQEEFDDWQAEIEAGDRDEEDGYDIATFLKLVAVRLVLYMSLI